MSGEAAGRTYINTTCKVGQNEPCGREATHVIAVTEVADTAWAEQGRDGGILGLCAFHAATPVIEWDDRTAPESHRLVTAEARAAHVEREAVALAVDYLTEAARGIQSDAADAAATLVNVGDLRRVLRALAALPQTGDAAAVARVEVEVEWGVENGTSGQWWAFSDLNIARTVAREQGKRLHRRTISRTAWADIRTGADQ